MSMNQKRVIGPKHNPFFNKKTKVFIFNNLSFFTNASFIIVFQAINLYIKKLMNSYV